MNPLHISRKNPILENNNLSNSVVKEMKIGPTRVVEVHFYHTPAVSRDHDCVCQVRILEVQSVMVSLVVVHTATDLIGKLHTAAIR